MEINAQQVKELRDKIGVSMMECKRALEQSGGNFDKAIDILRQKGVAVAQKKATRATEQGLVESYIHPGGKVGVLLQLNCETDFVARNDDFKSLAHDLCMQIAAVSPQYVRREEVPAEIVEKERSIYKAQLEGQKKPPQVLDKIVEGKLDKFYKEVCLLEQAFIKDDSLSIQDMITHKIAKLGENITLQRFVKFKVGEMDGKA